MKSFSILLLSVLLLLSGCSFLPKIEKDEPTVVTPKTENVVTEEDAEQEEVRKILENADGVMKTAELSDFEINFAEAMGDGYFVFDLEISNKEITDIQSTIEYYESGKFIKEIADFTTPLFSAELKEPIRMLYVQQKLNEKEEYWTTSVMTNNGPNNFQFNNNIAKKKHKGETNWSPMVMPQALFKGEKKVIAVVVSTDDKASIINEIKDEVDWQQVIDYDQVYVISIEIK
ncbi:hypothetical protein OEV98_14055 [Caldibacillus lycopersici]|uniref:Lipoprotein n=1 Tax=Perspicuibacillus lycopersici TaxID=1325689 RepID=A0AAE3IU55_9BACI|nr:hypothetical protein [Perspicuibacillus lycopersici]MCU9614663.1 hypothetical protein [Perspicuibacillus lycopersici]